MAFEMNNEQQEKTQASKPSLPNQSAAPSSNDDQKQGEGLRVSLLLGETVDARTLLKRGLLVLVVVLVICSVIIGGIYVFLLQTIKNRSADIEAKKTELTMLRKQIEEKEKETESAALFWIRMKSAGNVLDRHTYWSSFFTYLEKKTRPGIQYLNFSGNANSGVVTLDAIGRSYRDVAEQIVFLREDPYIVEVRTSSASARVNEVGEVAGVSFSLSLKIKPDAWQK